METIRNISLGVFHGFWDSIRGMALVLHIDAEMHKLNMEQQEERQRRQMERDRRLRHSPSPTPSSASTMEREQQHMESLAARFQRDNSDERSLESICKKPEPEGLKVVQHEKKIAKQVLKCCFLNGGFTWLSIILFEQLILPTLKYVLTFCYGQHSDDLHMIWGWLQSILSIIFGMMWVMPIFVLSKIVSSLWFADIANAAYRVRKGRPQMIPGLSKLVADFLFSIVVQFLFLAQSMLVNLVPMRYVGEVLCFVHLCMLYSLYSFEYKWLNMGWELHRRLSYIENNWPYFIGFGIPLTTLTSMTNSVIVSSCIFSIFFPLFILSGNEARPVVGTTETPLRLFSPVIFVSNLFFNRDGRAQKMAAARLAQQQQLQRQELLLKQQKQQQYYVQKRRSSNQREGNHEHQGNYMRPDSRFRDRSQDQQQNVRQDSRHRSQEQAPTYRYQQPPAQPQMPALRAKHTSSQAASTLNKTPPERNHHYYGMRPLIPTPVPGAPRAPTSAS